jgi:cytidine deaminase
MVAAGGRNFTEIVITTDTPKGCPPCGVCRQVLAEFAKDPAKAKVHVANLNGIVMTFTLLELLPEAFDGTYIKSP